jgi:hypothetical protein
MVGHRVQQIQLLRVIGQRRVITDMIENLFITFSRREYIQKYLVIQNSPLIMRGISHGRSGMEQANHQRQ